MENIILVDTQDNELGAIEKLQAHKKPLLHRAFSVFLYNDKKQILIQQRALNKYHSGGLWANSCCSHPRYGISFSESVINRVKFELGIDIVKFKEIFSFTYLTKFEDGLFEYEFDHVLVSKYNGDINFNQDEIKDAKWIDLSDLKKDLLLNPTHYASWFLICAPKVIDYLNNI